MKRSRPGLYLAWVDMLYGQVATFVALFAIAIALANPPAKRNALEQKAEYMVTLTWPDGSLDDVDLHLRLPDERALNFRSKEVDYVVLDHDDVGFNGRVTFPDGTVRLLGHKEIATVRALVPGTYVANVHLFRRNDVDWTGAPAAVKLPYSVHVTLTRINPRVEELVAVDVPLSEIGEQKTAFAFTVQPDGAASVDTHADVPFLELKQ
jgi:hypothetical protein